MPRGENRPSVLLSRDENDQVFSLIGPKCQSLATAVVQLFTTEGPGHLEWKKKDTGVLCLIKDNSKRSYFFRIYCLYRKTMIWEHEVYLQIEYKSPRPYLHTFEAEDYMTAFNFANEDEARVLRDILNEKIKLRKKRREEKRQRSMLTARTNSVSSHGSNISNTSRLNGVTPPPPPASTTPAPMTPAPMPAPTLPTQTSKTNTLSNYSLKSSSKKPKARKLTKADIGMPLDFKHVSHVGWDETNGFDVDLPEEEMRWFFSKAGITETQLKDHATRLFIYDFINKNGGMDAVKEELQDAPKLNEHSPRAPMPPPPPAPPVPSRTPHPPAPPSRAPPPPPARAVPPPPPPPVTLHTPRNPPPPRPHQPPPASAPPSVPPPPPPTSAPPPPPPPPPLAPCAPPAPPPPPMPEEIPAPQDARSALMESIRGGNKNLKHVEVGSKTSLNDDNRSNLMSEIRQGFNLKAVRRSDSKTGDEKSSSGSEPSGLAGALARALEERKRAIHSSDSEDSDDDSTSDGEWD